MTKFFLSAYDFLSRRKSVLFSMLAALAALLVFASSHLRFNEDISGFLPENKENVRINKAYRYISSSNKMMVYCLAADSSDEAKAAQIEATDALAERLQSLDSTYIKSLLYKIDPSEMAAITSYITENLPYFLDESDYARIDSMLDKDAIKSRLASCRELLVSPIGAAARESVLSDPLRITDPLLLKLQSFRIEDRFTLYQDHIFTDGGKAFMLAECAPPVSETVRNAELLDSLGRYIAETEKMFDGKVSFTHFGASEIGLANAKQIHSDTIFTCLLAAIAVFALLIYAFRSGKQILLVFAATLFGGLFALGLMYLIRGEVSIIAVGVSSIMFGIAINYPLHFIDHYNHAPDARAVIKDIIEPLTIGNITTVGAFLSLVFIGSGSMGDLGWFASLLLVGTILFVLFFLPHLLPKRKRKPDREKGPAFGRLVGRPFEKNKWFVLAAVLLTVFFGFFSRDSQFETDMQKINYMTPGQQDEYQRMTGLLNKNSHVVYFVTEGGTLDDALEANERLAPVLDTLLRNGDVSEVAGVGTFLPSKAKQTERLSRWQGFWKIRRDSVMQILRNEAAANGFKPDAFHRFEDMASRAWTVKDPAEFAVVKDFLAKNFVVDGRDGSMVVNLLYTEADKAPALEKSLNGKSQASIAFDAGSITRRMVASLSDNFNYVLYVCGFIVFAFLIFSMGRIELSLIAFLPLTLSWIWILGLMNIFGIKFNIVNIILATFIFGQGDDYTIFMTEGLMYEYAYGRKLLASYKNSIALSAVIMFIGMGMLILAKHPALRSLGEVTVVGMVSVVAMAYIFPSLLFRLLTVRKGKRRLMPMTLKNFLCTAYAFAFFLMASAAITIAGWFMFAFGRKTEKKKLAYHKLLHKVANFVVYRIPQVKTVFQNLPGETFGKPGVIICNHQSHIDLMCVMMLTPKLVVLTNDWAWNSPFYGKMIKYADFYPISNGIENALERLQEVVRRGYSIVVFPEGTRSADCSILRFHRGAFYLAERLGIDIVPVIIHGVGHVLPKEEFMLRKGRIHIRVMPRITPDDERFSRDYSARSREVRRYYRREYAAMCEQYETPDYYADLVMHNYIYKGPAIEREVRRNLRRSGNYAAEIAAMPDEGSVTIENVGYGEYPLLMALVKKRLKITATEADEDKCALAANCASVPGNLRYERAKSAPPAVP